MIATNYSYNGNQVYKEFNGHQYTYYIKNEYTDNFIDITFLKDQFMKENEKTLEKKFNIKDYITNENKKITKIDHFDFINSIYFGVFNFNNFRVKPINDNKTCSTKFKTNILNYEPIKCIEELLYQDGKSINFNYDELFWEFLNKTIKFYKDNINDKKTIFINSLIDNKLYLDNEIHIWSNNDHNKILTNVNELNDIFIFNHDDVNIVLGFKIIFIDDIDKLKLQVVVTDIQIIN